MSICGCSLGSRMTVSVTFNVPIYRNCLLEEGRSGNKWYCCVTGVELNRIHHRLTSSRMVFTVGHSPVLKFLFAEYFSGIVQSSNFVLLLFKPERRACCTVLSCNFSSIIEWYEQHTSRGNFSLYSFVMDKMSKALAEWWLEVWNPKAETAGFNFWLTGELVTGTGSKGKMPLVVLILHDCSAL